MERTHLRLLTLVDKRIQYECLSRTQHGTDTQYGMHKVIRHRRHYMSSDAGCLLAGFDWGWSMEERWSLPVPHERDGKHRPRVSWGAVCE